MPGLFMKRSPGMFFSEHKVFWAWLAWMLFMIAMVILLPGCANRQTDNFPWDKATPVIKQIVEGDR